MCLHIVILIILYIKKLVVHSIDKFVEEKKLGKELLHNILIKGDK